MMASLLQMNIASTSGSRSLFSNIVANPKGKLIAITTRSGLVIDGPTLPTPPKSITPKVDERVEETYTDPDLAEYTIKVPPLPVQKYKPPSQREFVVHKRDPLHPNIPYPSRMLKQKQLEKDEVQIQKIWQMFKQIHINVTLADALVLMQKYLKMLKALPSNKEKLQELANTPLNENCSAFDIESDLLANLDAIFVDPIPEMFTDEHTLDYSSPSKFDVYDADFLEVESDAESVYDDPFDSKGEKIKESKLLIDELDLPPFEYDSFIYQDFSRVDALPSTNNEDKDKKLAISNASLVLEDVDPPFYEPLFFKEVPKAKMLLPFSSKNKEKVFKPGIHTSKKVHSYFIPELSYPGYHVFEINQILKSLMKIFLYGGKNTPILDVPLFYLYPP
nr:hypothetical protein [Tanacetum cinerariifolium]